MNNTQQEPKKSICDELEDIIRAHPNDDISIDELMKGMHERGFGLVMMILVLPNCVPIPIPPGGSTIFSIPLLFISIQMVMGRKSPWLPRSLAQKTVSQAFLLKVLDVITPKIKKIERLLKPRLDFAGSRRGERVVGVFWLIKSISIAIPLPMTNFIPGIGILISGLGLISRDGYVILLGFLIGMIGVIFSFGLLIAGGEFIANFFS